MKEFVYYAKNICPSKITIHINDDKTVESVDFHGGCPGNHEGINSLCRGIKAENVIDRLKGIKCRPRPTSCPNELAVGIEYMLKHWDEMKDV